MHFEWFPLCCFLEEIGAHISFADGDNIVIVSPHYISQLNHRLESLTWQSEHHACQIGTGIAPVTCGNYAYFLAVCNGSQGCVGVNLMSGEVLKAVYPFTDDSF